MLPSRSLPRYSATAAGHANSTSAIAPPKTIASRRLMRPPPAGGRRGGVEDPQQVLVDGLDLQLGDAVVDVAHQAAPLAVAAHPFDEHAVVGGRGRAARARGAPRSWSPGRR